MPDRGTGRRRAGAGLAIGNERVEDAELVNGLSRVVDDMELLRGRSENVRHATSAAAASQKGDRFMPRF